MLKRALQSSNIGVTLIIIPEDGLGASFGVLGVREGTRDNLKATWADLGGLLQLFMAVLRDLGATQCGLGATWGVGKRRGSKDWLTPQDLPEIQTARFRSYVELQRRLQGQIVQFFMLYFPMEVPEQENEQKHNNM